MDEQEEIRHHYNARPNMNERDRRSTRNINIRQANNFVKACLIKKYIRPHDRVLDLGVGKGGDFAKYKSSRISELYGLDIANRSILDAVERAREGNYPFRIVLKTRDTYGQEFDLRRVFDVISAQFSFHYSFPSERTLDATVSNISRHLDCGGLLLLTILDKQEILRRRKARALSNSYYSITFKDPEFGGVYGNAYYYTLVDSVDSCVEYMVDMDELCRKLEIAGFRLVEEAAFDDFQRKEGRLVGNSYMQNKIDRLNPEEKAVFDLHLVVVFQKTR